MSPSQIELTKILNQQYLCESLTIKEVQTLLEYMEVVICKKKEIIAEIGEVGDALYFVVDGKVALLHDEHGNEVEVGTMGEGQLIGEMSFFDRKPRDLRIVAKKEHTQLLKLSRPMYDRLRVEHPYIAVNLLEHAIVSLDELVRSVSHDEAQLSRYIFGKGKR